LAPELGHFRRDLRLQPKSDFSRFAPVHRAGLGGQLRVDSDGLLAELGAKRQIETTGDERYSRIPSVPTPNTNAPFASRAVERRRAPAYDNSRINRHFLA